MEIGIIKERGGRGCDRRVVMMPTEVATLVQAGHQVLVETGAGVGLQIPDESYSRVGAAIVSPHQAWSCGLIVKLKSPTSGEAAQLKPGALVLTMLHQEQSPESALAIARAGGVGIAMEAICTPFGERLVDCTEMTGEQAMIFAFHVFEKVPADCQVLVLGYGRVATGAIETATRLGARVKILRRGMYPQVEHHLNGVDILVNGVSWPKEKRDRREYLVPRSLLRVMNRPAMVVDLAVDYPGPIETCRPTDMKEPIYEVDGIRHMCIYGYPALAPYSSSERYSRQLLPIVLELAGKGIVPELGDAVARAVVDWRGLIVSP